MADAHKTAGNEAFKAGRYDEAVREFTSAIELAPENHVLYSNRSAAHASLRDFAAAKEDAEKVRFVSPPAPRRIGPDV